MSLGAIAAPPPAVTVFTEKVVRQLIYNILTYPARVESRVNAIVRTESDGAVTDILKPLGSRVHRGEVVAVVKHTDPVYQYAPLNVIASVTGVVSVVHITPGSLVNKGDAIVTLTDPNQLRVMIEVPAADINSIHRGLIGDLSVASIPNLQAEVQGVSPAVDPMLGTASCEMKVSAKAQKKIMPGMVGSIEFQVNQHNGILLPDYAIVYRGENTFVRLVENGVAKRIPVKIGEKRHGQVEVLNGLKEGDQVIDRASRYVSDGEPVQVESAHE